MLKRIGLMPLYAAQNICAGNMDIIKRTCQFKTQITKYCRNSVLIVSVRALYLYLISLSLSIKYVHHHINFKACFSLPKVGLVGQVFLKDVLSTQNCSEGQKNPFKASFCHPPALHPMFS